MKKSGSLLLLLLASISLIGCKNNEDTSPSSEEVSQSHGDGFTPVHEHTFSSDFAYNATHHYHVSTCEHEDVVSSFEEHTFVNGVCSTCNALESMLPSEATLDEVINSFLGEEIGSSLLIDAALTLAKTIERRNVGKDASYIRYPFTYTSTLVDNSEVLLSGAITIPRSKDKMLFKGVTISSHTTFTDLSETPSYGFDPHVIPAITGTIVIECDGLGYGVSKDYNFNYHCYHLTGKNTLDGVKAAGNLINKMFNKNIFELPIFNMGYSQGGYDSLAFLRYLEKDATEEDRNLIKITKTFSASGAYDLSLMLKESLKNESITHPEYILMAFIPALSYHQELFNGLTYSDICTPTGLVLVDVLLQKSDEAISSFKSNFPHTLADIFLPDCFDENSDLFKSLCEVGDNENLLDGNWTPNGELAIYYSPKDDLVTPKCSEKAIELWGELENFKYVTIGSLFGGDHITSAIDYYLKVISEIADFIKNNK